MTVQTVTEYVKAHPELVAEGRQQMQRALARSASDAAFRRQLIENPRAALADVVGQPLPSSFNIKFVESTAAATIVLPAFRAEGDELSDAELEAVAGGLLPVLCYLAAATAGLALGGLIGVITTQ